MLVNQTEAALKNWRSRQVMSERLSTGILHLERYESVDPQHPLGGRDGGKDVVFTKNGEPWIAACFFPTTEPTFAEIRTKFQHDVKGAISNEAKGIAFFVNQHLSISERNELLALTNERHAKASRQ